MAPFPFSFWASYQTPPSPTPNPTPTPTPAVSRNYLITCSGGVGSCPGAGSVVIAYYEKVSGLLNSITLTGANLDAGYLLCARNYPNPPVKTSGSTPISITDQSPC